MSSHISNVRPAPDKLLTDLADYALGAKLTSDEAYDTARASSAGNSDRESSTMKKQPEPSSPTS